MKFDGNNKHKPFNVLEGGRCYPFLDYTFTECCRWPGAVAGQGRGGELSGAPCFQDPKEPGGETVKN